MKFSTFQSKIVRVLNLWQKNGVFKIEIIQPLLDMAAASAPPELLADNSANEEGRTLIYNFTFKVYLT